MGGNNFGVKILARPERTWDQETPARGVGLPLLLGVSVVVQVFRLRLRRSPQAPLRRGLSLLALSSRHARPRNDNHSFTIEPLDLDRLYANYLRTWEMAGIEPVPRDRADGMIHEWQEVLSGPPEPRRTERRDKCGSKMKTPPLGRGPIALRGRSV